MKSLEARITALEKQVEPVAEPVSRWHSFFRSFEQAGFRKENAELYAPALRLIDQGALTGEQLSEFESLEGYIQEYVKRYRIDPEAIEGWYNEVGQILTSALFLETEINELPAPRAVSARNLKCFGYEVKRFSHRPNFRPRYDSPACAVAYREASVYYFAGLILDYQSHAIN